MLSALPAIRSAGLALECRAICTAPGDDSLPQEFAKCTLTYVIQLTVILPCSADGESEERLEQSEELINEEVDIEGFDRRLLLIDGKLDQRLLRRDADVVQLGSQKFSHFDHVFVQFLKDVVERYYC